MNTTWSVLQLKTTHLLWVILLCVLLIRALFLRWRHRKVYSFMASVPGPLAFPFIGSAYLLIGTTMGNVCGRLKTIVKNYPKMCSYWDCEQPHILTGDREVFNAILGSLQNTDKFRHYDHFKTICNGMFSTSGPEWRKMRKIINPCFRSNVLAAFDDNFYDLTQIFVDNLGKHASGTSFDIFQSVHLCTIDLIFDNVMELRMDIQKNDVAYLSTSLTTISEMCFERAFSPLLWPNFVYSLVGKQKKFDESLNKLSLFIEKAIDERIKIRDEQKSNNSSIEKSNNFMEVMLNNVDLGIITKERVFSEVFEMFIAGSITTAMTTSWVFKMLAMFPDIQERAYREIAEISDGKAVPVNEVSRLVYVEMVIKETLRHFTIPVMGRRITEDLKVNEKITIPAGVQIFLGTYALHHDTEHWENPGQFYPDHFSAENENSRPKGAFVPFLSGPRACPGYQYAMKSMKIMVANTLLSYKFTTDEIPPEDMRDLDYRLIFMIWPASGYKVKITKR